jgi:hypothetical protein
MGTSTSPHSWFVTGRDAPTCHLGCLVVLRSPVDRPDGIRLGFLAALRTLVDPRGGIHLGFPAVPHTLSDLEVSRLELLS